MVSLIAKWWILPGKENVVVPALKKLARAVQAEKGTHLYLVHTPDVGGKGTSLPVPGQGEVVFVEVYGSWKDFLAHLAGPAFTTFKRDYGAMFVQGSPEPGATGPQPFVEVEFLDRVAGFAR